MPQERKSDLTTIWHLMYLARAYWAHMGMLFLLSLLSTPLALMMPVPLKIAVDSVIGSDPLPGFLAFLVSESITQSSVNVLLLSAVLVVGIAVIQQLQSAGTQFLSTYVGEKLVMNFRSQMFLHAQRLSLSEHDSKGTYDAIYRVTYDANAIRWVTIDCMLPLFILSITFTSMVYVMLAMDLYLALVALIVTPIIYLTAHYCRPALRRNWQEVWNLRSNALAVVQEALTSLRVVKAFGQEHREQERLNRRSQDTVNAHIGVALREICFNFLMGLTTAIGTAVVLYIGILHVQQGVLTLGDMLIVMSYLAQVYGPLRSMGQQVAQLQSALASADRTFRMFDEPPDVPERANPRRISRATGAISFRNVSFSYDGRDPVLQDISFEIEPGTCLGIAGASGAGKTTLTSLLIRFFDPTAGEIRLDGVDIREYKIDDLRKQFSYVLQDPVLFSSSIAENIGYGRPNASSEEIVAAAKAANAHDFVTKLPDGYDTLVGERGMMLSGGERQRISLARAFLKDSSVLIFDEPTSSIDVSKEAEILEALEKLIAGRTTIMIAHRLSTLRDCDVLMVLQNGRLVTVTTEVKRALKDIGSRSRSRRAVSALKKGAQVRL